MITDADIKNLVTAFKTRAESDVDIEKQTERFDLKFNQVLDRLDAVFKELQDFRQEQSFHIQSHMDIDEAITATKKRLDKLELKTAHI